MCKRLCLLASLVMFLVAAPSFAGVGVFDNVEDVGYDWDSGTDIVTDLGGGSYEITGGGGDLWDWWDQGTYAYNAINGDMRLTADPSWIKAQEWWAKMGVMVRTTADRSAAYYGAIYPYHNNGEVEEVKGQFRRNDGDNSADVTLAGKPVTLGVQRKLALGVIPYVETFTDVGSGPQLLMQERNWNFTGEVTMGAFVMSHDAWRWQLATAQFDNVAYTADPDWVGDAPDIPVTDIPVEGLSTYCLDDPGFRIKVVKAPLNFNGDMAVRDETYATAEWLVVHENMGPDNPSPLVAYRDDQVVNLYDTGGYNAFDDDTEKSFPGVDALIINPSDPADGDDDDQFAVLVTACIELTEGIHIFGGAFDDGVKMEIGGVEIGRTAAWNEVGEWVVNVDVAGKYPLKVVGYEIGGGAYLELYYRNLDTGALILLGDVANGSPAVYIPEPATIALLGFGGLSMLRIRRKR